MNFDQCVAEIEALSGELVKVEILGPRPDGGYLADFWGILGRVGEPEPLPAFAEELARATGEVAVSFVVGDGSIALWPSRFLSAALIEHRAGWFEVDTRDATIRIGPKRPPWFD